MRRMFKSEKISIGGAVLFAMHLIIGLPLSAQEKTTSVEGWGLSMAIGQGEAGQFRTHFTTFDGNTNRLPLSENIGGSPVYSRQWFPSNVDPRRFLTDYITFGFDGGVLEYGSIELLMPTGDADFNGVPDVLQSNQAGEFSFSGNLISDFPSRANFSASGVMRRDQGSPTGTYSLRFSGNGRNINYEGPFELNRWEGSARYQRGTTNKIHFDLVYYPGNGNQIPLSGETPFTVVNREAMNISAFQLTDSFNRTYSVAATQFVRTGKTYRASWNLADGFLTTSWTDYLSHVFELEDENDSDNDGIPDLTDEYIPLANITTHPQSQAVAIGGSVVLSVTATGQEPISYQWRFNGENLVFGTTRTLTLTGFKLANVGFYDVRVSNPGGSVLSDPAELVLLEPPVIVSHPQGLSAPVGMPVTLSVSATGNGVLTYQWFKNNQVINGANQPVLELGPVALSHQGNYTVRVSNDAGQMTSSPAALKVEVASLSIRISDSNGVLITIRGASGIEYILQVSTNLKTWQELTRVEVVNGSVVVMRPLEVGTGKFYRTSPVF